MGGMGGTPVCIHVSLGLGQSARKQREVTDPHGWVDGPYCAGMWLTPVPLVDIPMDAGPGSDQQVRAEVIGQLAGRQQSILFLLRFQ